MSVITKVLKQTAVYWPPIELDAFNGEAAYDDFGNPVPRKVSPIELSCRWEDMENQSLNEAGTSVTYSSKVMVSEDVKVGGLLMLGALSDAADSFDNDNPRDNEGVFEIMKFDKIPNFKNTEYLRVAYL